MVGVVGGGAEGEEDAGLDPLITELVLERKAHP